MKFVNGLGLLCLGIGSFACHVDPDLSDQKVTNGATEMGFDYVVRIVSDNGSCTGTFVSDSLLLTAAHCVFRTSTISYMDTMVYRNDFFIHPSWLPEAETEKREETRFDLAMVRFPDRTFQGEGLAKISHESPEPGERLRIVGYGNDRISVFSQYCRLTANPRSDGLCHVEKGIRVLEGRSEYEYSSAFSYDPGPVHPVANGMRPAQCTKASAMAAFAEAATEGRDWETFVAETCSGNLRDRPYKETGAGTKRSGENIVERVGDGVITFVGSLGGDATGLDAASGAGDSGGPLFIERNGEWVQAGVTHGGSLIDRGESVAKRTIYVDLNDEQNAAWLRSVVHDQGLSFPGL